MEFLHKTALELKIHLLAVGPGLGNVSGTSIENKINQNLLHNYKPTFICFLSIIFTGCYSIQSLCQGFCEGLERGNRT